ncbi:PQ loop repeat-domain-containing protein [Xylariomycetidae sp. FL2044]|nr:PQ loop repeat-domain-containing protein [Xylariomycetidae sp. FL2044]
MGGQNGHDIAANVLGTIGTILWCVQLIPQIWTNWRSKKTDGLPSSMMFLWALCGVPFGAYNIVQDFNYPLQVQPQAFMVLCLVSWTQTLLYGHNWKPLRAIALGLATAAIFAGVETALILTLEPLYDRGKEYPIVVVGIIAAILLAAGLLPPYGEIWKRRGRVIGINWIFLSMDWFGAFFSLMSLVAQRQFDILGGVMYIVCMLLELGIFTSHIIWLIRTRKIRREAGSRGKTFEDLAQEHVDEGRPFGFAERESWRKRWQRRRRGQGRNDDGDGDSDDVEKRAAAVGGTTNVEGAKRAKNSPVIGGGYETGNESRETETETETAAHGVLGGSREGGSSQEDGV